MALSILIGTYGIFTLTPPYSISAINYKITKLNLISALVENGVDVYSSYYQPVGLTRDQYTADTLTDAAIVTLESPDGPTVNVPSGYLSLSPVEPSVPYSNLVIAIQIGDLPDTVDISEVLDDIRTMADGTIGNVCTTTVHMLPATKLYSHEDHILYEAQRESRKSAYLSFYKGKVSSNAELSAEKITNQRFQEIIKSQALRIAELEDDIRNAI